MFGMEMLLDKMLKEYGLTPEKVQAVISNVMGIVKTTENRVANIERDIAEIRKILESGDNAYPVSNDQPLIIKGFEP